MIIIKKIWIILSLLICLFSLFLSVKAEDNKKIIVIDPGHGGMDPGSNSGDIKESDIVLDISFKIKEVFEIFGYNVVLTRTTKESLCDGKFIKKEDTEKRINIINSNNTILVLSIHLNEFGLSQYRGSQVFFNNNNILNKILSDNIQKSLKNYLKNTNRNSIKKENNYLLKRLTVPACIVECGFISNQEELELLLDYKYQYKLAMALLYGVNDYLTNLTNR